MRFKLCLTIAVAFIGMSQSSLAVYPEGSLPPKDEGAAGSASPCAAPPPPEESSAAAAAAAAPPQDKAEEWPFLTPGLPTRLRNLFISKDGEIVFSGLNTPLTNPDVLEKNIGVFLGEVLKDEKLCSSIQRISLHFPSAPQEQILRGLATLKFPGLKEVTVIGSVTFGLEPFLKTLNPGQLTHLTFNSVNVEEIETITKCLELERSQGLTLSNLANFNDYAFRHIFTKIGDLTSLYLWNCGLTDQVITILLQELPDDIKFKKLQLLALRDAPLSKKGVTLAVDQLIKGVLPSLKEFDCLLKKPTNVSPEEVRGLMRRLQDGVPALRFSALIGILDILD